MYFTHNPLPLKYPYQIVIGAPKLGPSSKAPRLPSQVSQGYTQNPPVTRYRRTIPKILLSLAIAGPYLLPSILLLTRYRRTIPRILHVLGMAGLHLKSSCTRYRRTISKILLSLGIAGLYLESSCYEVSQEYTENPRIKLQNKTGLIFDQLPLIYQFNKRTAQH